MNRTERSVHKRSRRRRLVVATVALLVLAAIRIVGFWGGSGGFVQFIAGQRSGTRIAIAADATVSPSDSTPQVRVRVTLGDRVHRVEPEYVSLAIDLSQVTGGLWWDPAAQGNETGSGTVAAPQFDFARPQLDALVAPPGACLSADRRFRIGQDLLRHPRARAAGRPACRRATTAF